jgi:hypothetical protein
LLSIAEWSISTQSYVNNFQIPIIIYPLSGDKIEITSEYIEFVIPYSSSDELINIIATIKTPLGVTLLTSLSRKDYINWTYFDGTEWKEWPILGVPRTYHGNHGRFYPKNLQTSGLFCIELRGVYFG